MGKVSICGRQGNQMTVHTDVCGQVSDRREEDLDIGTGDKLGVHSSGILKQRTPQQALGTASGSVSTVPYDIRRKHSHAEPLCNAREVPHRLDSGLADSNLHTRVSRAFRTVRIDQGLALEQDLPVNHQVSLARSLVNLAELHVCARDSDARANVEPALVELVLEDLRHEVVPVTSAAVSISLMSRSIAHVTPLLPTNVMPRKS